MLNPAFLRSSVGRKAIVGITGLLLIGFVLAHLLGNLTIFLGPDALNAYAEKLRHLGPLLWVARIGLLVVAIVHVVFAIKLSIENRAARGPVGYAQQRSLGTSAAAKTMALSGILLLTFIVYHLAHFTFGLTHPAIAHLKDPLQRHDVYTMVVLGFQQTPVAIGYVIAMFFLSRHLSHGIQSMFQSIGLNDERHGPLLEQAGRVIAGVIFIGYSAIPMAVICGFLTVSGGRR